MRHSLSVAQSGHLCSDDKKLFLSWLLSEIKKQQKVDSYSMFLRQNFFLAAKSLFLKSS